MQRPHASAASAAPPRPPVPADLDLDLDHHRPHHRHHLHSHHNSHHHLNHHACRAAPHDGGAPARTAADPARAATSGPRRASVPFDSASNAANNTITPPYQTPVRPSLPPAPATAAAAVPARTPARRRLNFHPDHHIHAPPADSAPLSPLARSVDLVHDPDDADDEDETGHADNADPDAGDNESLSLKDPAVTHVRNPIKRLSRLLLEEARIGDRERAGEAVVQDLITLELTDWQDAEGDAVMMDHPDQLVLVKQRAAPLPGSHLNPSRGMHYSPSTPASSNTPSPTVVQFPPISVNTLPLAANPRSPRALLPAYHHYSASSPPPLLLGKRSRTSSISETPARKRTRVGDAPDPAALIASPSAHRVSAGSRSSSYSSPSSSSAGYMSAGASSSGTGTAAPTTVPIHNNAGKQMPHMINIQGASLAFSKLDLHGSGNGNANGTGGGPQPPPM
ncbi:hypothetical protein AMAG_10929 [Allomyces macrogynus ATCC 38327]|uniref:Uncharacterized protein n=1 Tax=Allomyces macrogynus (strain ATCC 38327) TaxID=578462 RepID=A0A0L0SRZ4_ALLM3|nr:hypothetical protein AMAG_10929 [Allomyces macrogynus ATCC 38327]|eukprot:KNE65287.1 hypothetical protein AMAG_10929 [Allomyces macrogynus ATCC 38327]